MTFQIVGAGAGSGKTHHIQTTLTGWIAAAEVVPDRVLAVTFTEAAASELKERLRGALLDAGRPRDAVAIGRAYVSTIHALGLRIVTEHAFAAGLSPGPRMIEAAEAELLLRRAIAESDVLQEITADLASFGYRTVKRGADWASAADMFRADLRAVIARLDGLGDYAADETLANEAAAALAADWGEVAADGTPLDDALRRTVQSQLDAFPDGIATPDMKDGPRKTFETDHRALRRIRDQDILSDWSWWQSLRDLRLTKRGCPTPEGYDDLAQGVMAAADALPRHPGPRNQACRHLTALIRGAQDVRARYAEAKTRLGAIDYGDMIAGAERVLRAMPDALASMLGGLDCVVVDEFQDTNPVQFALLARLIEAVPRTILVGDAKQAIMGFQGADPRLSQALARAHPDAASTLDRNWRSVPGIMDFANDIGAGLFADYTPLAPQRTATGADPVIEVLQIAKGRASRAPSARPYHHVATRIRDLLDDPVEIADRATGAPRPAAAPDIAVLCRTHSQVETYAQALRDLGVPVDVEETGWHDAPAVAATRAALAFAADPRDTLSGLTFACLGPPRLPLEDGLAALADGRFTELDALAPLATLAPALNGWPAPRALAAVRAAAGIDAWAAALPDPDRTMADLARLAAEASAFAISDPATRAAAGLHGWCARAFLAWLAVRVSAGDGSDRRPDPNAAAGRGVRLLTWHASKGLEWPVVVVAGLDATVAERPGTPRIAFEGWDDPATLLSRARLRWHPKAAAPEIAERFATDRRPDAARTERCLAYVALTRARDRLILEWPAWEKPENDTLFRLLGEEAGLTLAPGGVAVTGCHHPARLVACPEGMPAAFDEPSAPPPPVPYVQPGRLVAPPPPGPEHILRPSAAAEGDALWNLQVQRIGPALPPDAFESAQARGTVLHLALRTLMARPDRRDALSAATGLADATVAALAGQAAGLVAALDADGLSERLHELPFEVASADGSALRGIADLVARYAAGQATAVIDFKSPAPGDPADALDGYLGQLHCYATAVRSLWPEARVSRLGVFFLGSGTLVWGAPASR
ncbi:UvrD-helicase domain-containing protein [uncultured Jannaschia sp.]|uniref:UvrD-helicase domain-containing protein n=1 Tax=uncultured Jannaschia sp. TaxID=293347 RepID=UPI00261694B0|nr:UvrD-helicase domain-containing protein [uncultured Jannaschia sp.]